MKITLNIFPGFVLGIGAALLMPFMASAVGPVGPSGDFSETVTNAADAVWDFEGVVTNANFDVSENGPEVQANIPAAFTQSGAGKISGSATDVPMSFTINGLGGNGTVPLSATVTEKGSISSTKGSARFSITFRASGTATLPSSSHSSVITLSEQINATINSTNQTITGSMKSTASDSSHGSITETMTFANPLSDVGALGDGSWTLNLNGLSTTGTKVTGTATVTLNSGQVFNYSIKGSFSSTKGTLLLLSGSDANSKGSTITVTLNTSDVVTNIKGKISGQTVNVSP